MPGTIVVNTRATFATALLMSCGPKIAYMGTDQDRTAAGLLKWQAEVAVTYTAEPGQRAVSEVLSVTIAADHDPAAGVDPGTPVELVDLRAGVSQPEARESGKGIRGGRLWWQASGLRPAVHLARKGEAA